MPTVLITGATDGLGRYVARDLAAQGWTVLVYGRSLERASDVGIGSGAGASREESADGYELTFAVNYLSRLRLTLRLLDAAPSRIANVASAGQQAINLDDVQLEHELQLRGSSLSTVEEGALASERRFLDDVGTGKYFNGQREARAYDAQHGSGCGNRAGA